MRALSRLAAAFAACALAVACGLADDDYTGGVTSHGAAGSSSVGGGAGAQGGKGGSTGVFPDGGTAATGGKSTGFPDSGPAGGQGGAAAGSGGAGQGGAPAGAGGTPTGAGGTPEGAGGMPTGAGGTPPPAPFCGDGKRDPGESCDAADFGGATCASVLGRPDASGPLNCGPGCQIDTAGCLYCGDGAPNGAENCNSCPVDTGTCCTSRCCDGSLTPTTGQKTDGDCQNAGAFLCGGLGLSRSNHDGNDFYPSYCQIKCNTFQTWHTVGAPDLDPPACSHDKAVAYCAPHGGYKDGNIVHSACPM